MDMEFYLKRRVYIHNGHWLWTKCLNTGGYGQLWVNGIVQLAHRVSYITFVGPVPEDRPYILHKRGVCRIRKCICPDHLYCGTPQDNMDDRAADVPISGGRPPNIPEEIIKTIRQRCSMGESQADIAREYKISPGHVCEIANNKKRKDVK